MIRRRDKKRERKTPLNNDCSTSKIVLPQLAIVSAALAVLHFEIGEGAFALVFLMFTSLWLVLMDIVDCIGGTNGDSEQEF